MFAQGAEEKGKKKKKEKERKKAPREDVSRPGILGACAHGLGIRDRHPACLVEGGRSIRASLAGEVEDPGSGQFGQRGRGRGKHK